MSGQWETVGKKKEKGSQKIAPPQTNNKKKIENFAVKVEDVLAKSQVKNLYSNDKNKENKPLEVKKSADLGAKKTQKKQEKPVEIQKSKAPKSIESALKQIDVEEFNNVFEKSRSHFPDAPIVWLKDLAHFLNQKINIELQDPVFTQKPRNFPLNIVPSAITGVIEKAVHLANETNVQLFFDIALTSMVTDMSKNQPAVGHKVILQYIAINKPSLVVANLGKHCILRTSYQNRPNIGLSVLWAVGQVGISNFEAGLKVFQELMLPLIELKNYSRFVVQYLLDLISCNNDFTLSRDQFFFILELIFSNKKNFPNDLKQSLVDTIPNLKSCLFSGNKKEAFKNSLEIYLKKLAASESDACQQCLCDVIVEGFTTDPSSIEHWGKAFVKNTTASAILLQYVDRNWNTISDQLNKKIFIEVLKQVSATNSDFVVKKKKDDGLIETIRIAKKLLEKMTEKKKSRSSFKFLFILICLTVGSFIYLDVKQKGSWQKSNTNRILKQYGVCEYVHVIQDKFHHGLLLIDQQIEDNFPTQRQTVIEFSTPYVDLSRNLGRVFYNIILNINEVVQEKYPVVLQSIESYAPGFVEHSQNAVRSAWSSSIFYFNKSVDYLQKEVFVGQLSPENMQKVVIEAFNTTQHKASEYYHWLYEKVQSAIK
ncbi:hypothetical protein Zmor_024025 [Zophobas morio]|uniref:Transmembrane protein 214-A n=1 Tax=Zophobas morio TaxID=2755281 RepID=A0AA38I256_9CUCU|nr:hypothetical protein Zmor_024025 [Zophobas morio]